MTFREILEKLCGKRLSCSAGCCGGVDASAQKDSELDLEPFLAVRLLAACILFTVALLVTKLPDVLPPILLIVSALIAGYDILAAAILSVMNGRYFDKSAVMTIAAVLAFAIGQNTEGAALLLLYQIGGMFIDYVFARTRRSIIDAVSCETDTAHVAGDGGLTDIAARNLNIGDIITILQGETVPCDCMVHEGTGSVDASPLGGSSEPQYVTEGDEILSGCVVVSGTFECEVTAIQADSAAAVLRKNVCSASANGSPVPKPLGKFLSVYTPVTVAVAVLAAVVLPLAYDIGVTDAVYRALVFLVLANPCALFVALPLIRFSAIGGAAKDGILFGGNAVMDDAAGTCAVVFSREGTLTDGCPRVSSVKPERFDADTLLKVTAHAMAYSGGAAARSIIASYGGEIYIELIDNFSDIPGKGVEVYVDGVRICAGNLDLMEEKGVTVPEEDKSAETAVYVSVAEEYAGRILLTEGIRADAAAGIEDIRSLGISTVMMFTDEPAEAAARTSSELGIKEYSSGYDHGEKLSAIEDMKRGTSRRDKLMYVSNGESPAGEHTAADLDVSMRDIDALAALGSSDITLTGGRVSAIASAISRSKYAVRSTMITMAAVLAVKLLLMVLAFVGVATLWFAVFIDSAAALGAMLLSIRVYGDPPRKI